MVQWLPISRYHLPNYITHPNNHIIKCWILLRGSLEKEKILVLFVLKILTYSLLSLAPRRRRGTLTQKRILTETKIKQTYCPRSSTRIKIVQQRMVMFFFFSLAPMFGLQVSGYLTHSLQRASNKITSPQRPRSR